tara:strand:+ start:18010 stop:19005 length:996 start_codon:yes stop_codon:yes gene_type:complete
MRALITGGAGFIGTRLVTWLHDRADEIFVYDSREKPATGWGTCVNLLGHDRVLLGHVQDMQRMSDLVQRIRPDVVLHLAAQSHVDASIKSPTETIEANVLGTHVVAMVCARWKVPLVYCSTDEVYGDALGCERASREYDPLEPSSPYSASKASGELLVRAISRTFGLDFAITRGTNAFGPGQYPEKLIPIACRMLHSGERVQLHGGGFQIRQWVHVDEFAECLALVAQRLVERDEDVIGQTFNIAGPERISVIGLVEMLAKRMGVSVDDAHEATADRPGGDAEYYVDGSRARDVLGFQAKRVITHDNELELLISEYASVGCFHATVYGGAA